MSELPIVIRPAWRNHWFLMLVIALLVLLALYGTVTNDNLIARVPIVFWILAAMAGILLAYRRLLWRFEIDKTRLKTHKGVVTRHQQSIRFKDLRSIELRQGLIQRIFNVGNLAFYTSGSAEAEVEFHGISSPSNTRDYIKEVMDREKDEADRAT